MYICCFPFAQTNWKRTYAGRNALQLGSTMANKEDDIKINKNDLKQNCAYVQNTRETNCFNDLMQYQE